MDHRIFFKDGQSAGELNFSSASVQSEADEDGVIGMLNLSLIQTNTHLRVNVLTKRKRGSSL